MSDLLDADVKTLAAATQAQFDAKDFAGALAGYDELRRADPGDGFYTDRYGYCFIALGRWRDAEAAWLDIIRDHGASKGRVGHVLQCRAETGRYELGMEFIRRHLPACASDPSLIVYHVTAALGCGDAEDAAQVFLGLDAACPAAKRAAAYSQLGYRLLVLGRQGHADAAFAFIDRVLPSVADPTPLLEAGARVSAGAKRWPSQIAYLDRLIALDPTVESRHLEKASALLSLGDDARCEAWLAEFRERFPPALRTGTTEQRLQGLEIRARSLGHWRKTLDTVRPTPSFQGLTFRAAAHAALNQHQQAIEAAQSGLALYGDHPWFQGLIGKSHDALGETGSALGWLTRAASAADAPTDTLLALLRIQIKAGQTDAAAALGARLCRRHRASAFIRGVLAHLGLPQAVEAAAEYEPAPAARGPVGWLHGGDAGDVVYALATMQAAGGGHLYLTCIDATREPMDSRKIDFLMPLLTAQSYVVSAGPWQGEPVQRDFNVMRALMPPDLDLAALHWRAVMDEGALDVTQPWLKAPHAARHGRPVFARSGRYRNPGWEPFWAQLKAAGPDAIFVGTAAEFEDFGHGEHYLARDALDLAEVIHGGSIFIGNQSLPYAIAEGLKMGRLLEASPYVRNCLFPGALALAFG